jgi:hypothetical protein
VEGAFFYHRERQITANEKRMIQTLLLTRSSPLRNLQVKKEGTKKEKYILAFAPVSMVATSYMAPAPE